ncbi:MAG: metallophosphoesterase [Nitrospira sp.]|nr:metallophosphoesterase [Nitrospira sp.]
MGTPMIFPLEPQLPDPSKLQLDPSFGSSKRKIVESPVIDIEIFCRKVSAACIQSHIEVSTSQAYESLGAICNRFLGYTLETRSTIIFNTREDFSSKTISRSSILSAIQKCTGENPDVVAGILEAIKRVLREFFKSFRIGTEPTEVIFSPFDRLFVNYSKSGDYYWTLRIEGSQPYDPTFDGKRPVTKTIFASFIHLSDLHFGSKEVTEASTFKKFGASALPSFLGDPLIRDVAPHSYQAWETLCIQLQKLINRRNLHDIPVCAVDSGDITLGGKKEQFENAEHFLCAEKTDPDIARMTLKKILSTADINLSRALNLFFAIPGNHDTWGGDMPFNPFQRSTHINTLAAQEFFGPSRPLIITFTTRAGYRICLYGIDSSYTAEADTRLAIGDIRSSELEYLIEAISINSLATPTALQILAIHHPVAMRKQLDAGKTTMRLKDRDRIAKKLLEAGIDLVLAGHVHEDDFLEKSELGDHPAQDIVAPAIQQHATTRTFRVIDFYEDSGCIEGLFHTYAFDRKKVRFTCKSSTIRKLASVP